MAIKTVITIDANGRPASREIDRVTDDVTTLDAAADDVDFDGATESAGLLGGTLSGVVDTMTGPAGIALGAAAVGKFLFDATTEAIELGRAAEVTALQLNATVEEGSRLNTVFTQAGLDADQVSEVTLTIAEKLAESADLAELLGVKAGSALEPMDAIRAAVDGWELLTATQRIQVFGEEGVKAVAQIVRRGGDLEDQLQAINDASVITGDELVDLKSVESALDEFSELWDALRTEVGVSSASVVSDVLTIGEALGDLAEEHLNPDAWLNWLPDWLKGDAVGPTDALSAVADLLDGKLSGAIVDTGREFDDLGADATAAGTEMTSAIVGSFTEINRATQEAGTVFDEWKSELDVWDEAQAMGVAYDEFAAGAEGSTRGLVDEFLSFVEVLDTETREKRVIEMQAALRAGDVEEIERIIAAATRDRTITIRSTFIPGSGGQIPQPGLPDGGTQSTTNINVTMAGTVSSREMSNMVTSWQNNG